MEGVDWDPKYDGFSSEIVELDLALLYYFCVNIVNLLVKALLLPCLSGYLQEGAVNFRLWYFLMVFGHYGGGGSCTLAIHYIKEQKKHIGNLIKGICHRGEQTN